MKKTKYHILRTIEKWNIKIVEKDKIDNPNTPRLFVKHLSEFQFWNKMKIFFLKIPHRQNSSKTIRKIVEIEAKSISPIYIYTTSHYHRYTYTRPPTITAHSLDTINSLQYSVAGQLGKTCFINQKLPLLLTCCSIAMLFYMCLNVDPYISFGEQFCCRECWFIIVIFVFIYDI